jgi:RNA recognition motif-containing protein
MQQNNPFFPQMSGFPQLSTSQSANPVPSGPHINPARAAMLQAASSTIIPPKIHQNYSFPQNSIAPAAAPAPVAPQINPFAPILPASSPNQPIFQPIVSPAHKKPRLGWDTAPETLPPSFHVISIAPCEKLVPTYNPEPNIPRPEFLQLAQLLQSQQLLLANELSKLTGGGKLENNQLQAKNSLERRLYVGSLNYTITEEQVKSIFQPFGQITKVDMPRDAGVTRSKGFCFVEFSAVESCLAALMSMQGVPIQGRAMKLGRPQGIVDDFSTNSGPAQAILATINLPFWTNQNLNPALLGQAAGFNLPNNPSINVAQAASLPHQAKNNSRIYIGSLSWDVDEQGVREIFSSFGSIRAVQMAVDPTGQNKHRGYCFVEYEEEKSANDAISAMNGFELMGRQLKVNHATANAGLSLTSPASAVTTANWAAQPTNTFAQVNPSLASNPAAQAILAAAGANLAQNSADALSLSREENLRISSHTQRAALMQKLARSGRESPVILLKNLISTEDVDGELEGEVAGECKSFGNVLRVKIHMDKLLEKVYIYVVFDSIEGATKAVEGLHGRYFGGRVVEAKFYPKIKFDANIFTDAD